MDKQERVSKDIFLESVNNLGNIQRWELKDSPVVQVLAEFAYKYQIRNLQLVDDLVERLAPLLQAGNATTSVPELTSDSLLTSDFLADRILPWIELVRTELFGSRDAPFHGIRQSEQWIDQQAKDQRLLPVGGKFDEPISSGRFRLAVPPKRTFEYMGEDGKVHKVTMTDIHIGEWKDPELRPRRTEQGIPALRWLENETRIMARSTGFTQPALIQFILVGVRPVLPRYQVRGETVYQVTPAGDILQPFHVEIEIRARDLGFEELRQIYQIYRRQLQSRKAKALNEEHWLIYRLVKERGGPLSGKGSVQFWKSVMEEWNTLHPEKRYSHWKGIKIIYERIIKRLEVRFKTRSDDKRQPI